MKKIIYVSILAIISFMASAQAPKIYALHINGINTTSAQASENLLYLKKVSLVSGDMVQWATIWNPTGNDAGKTTLDNLKDVANQKKYEDQANMSLDDFTNSIIAADPVKYPPHLYYKGTPEYAVLESQSAQLYAEQLSQSSGTNFDYILQELHGTVPAEFASVLQLIGGTQNPSGIVDYSKSPNYVLLLPHSQGNLYANSLLTYLTNIEHFDKQKIATFSIATPAKNNVGGWISDAWKTFYTDNKKIVQMFGDIRNYLTSTNDYVIASANAVFKKNPSLKANFQIVSSTDWKGHSLIDTYLTDPDSKEAIASMISYDLYIYYLEMTRGYDDNLDYQILPNRNYRLVNATTQENFCENESCNAGVYFNTPEYKTGYLLSKDMLPLGRYYWTVDTQYSQNLTTAFRLTHSPTINAQNFNDLCLQQAGKVTCTSKPQNVLFANGVAMSSNLRQYLPYAQTQLAYRFWKNWYISSVFTPSNN
jgi:hypothetical protein